MGRGRKPLPSHMRVITGNAGRRPINTDEPTPTAPIAPDAPRHLTPRQQEIYAEARATAPEGLLGNLDESVFIAWVVAYDLHQQYNDDVGKYGRWVKAKGAPTGMAANPAIAQLNKQAKILQSLAAEMGFSPSARSRVKVDPNNGKTKAGNPFQNLKTFGAED